MKRHQDISGVSDKDFVELMVGRHRLKFDESFWKCFDSNVSLEPDVAALDIGCGPGLFLQDLDRRYASSRLVGIDITPAMLEHARTLEFQNSPELITHDVTVDRIPFDANTFDLVAMISVLHIPPDPFSVIEEIQRVLRDDGVLLIRDWVRSPLSDYLAHGIRDRSTAMRLFPEHNKYTVEDWLWIFQESGFLRVTHQRVGGSYGLFFCRAGI